MIKKISVTQILTTLILLCSSKFVLAENAWERFQLITKPSTIASFKDLPSLHTLLNHKYDNELEKVITVNQYFNRFHYSSDEDLYAKDDYWASPLEFIDNQAGDCEDYAIAKYSVLKALGIKTSQLFLSYVNQVDLRQAHMVLLYFPEDVTISPLVLDNQTNDILPIEERTDLNLIYSFNQNKAIVGK